MSAIQFSGAASSEIKDTNIKTIESSRMLFFWSTIALLFIVFCTSLCPVMHSYHSGLTSLKRERGDTRTTLFVISERSEGEKRE